MTPDQAQSEIEIVEEGEPDMFQRVGGPANAAVAKAGQALAARREQDNIPAVPSTFTMIDRALASNVSPDILEKLFALHERVEASNARKAFDEAMSAAKAEIPVIAKNRVVDFTGKTGIRTHYRHEDLGEIARTVDPILAKHGLSYRFRTTSAIGEPISVTCIVSHRAGHSEENTLVGPRDESGNKNPLQQVGSTIAFLQRYTLKAALGLAAAHDDDGRSSSGDDHGSITEEQASTIRALCAETDTDIPKFCELMKVEAIPELPASEYKRVIDSLNAKKRRLAS